MNLYCSGMALPLLQQTASSCLNSFLCFFTAFKVVFFNFPMIWTEPSQLDTDNAALEKRLWDTGTKAHELGRLYERKHAVHGLEGEIEHGGNINSHYHDSRNLVTPNSIFN